jgi:hypothetical protein
LVRNELFFGNKIKEDLMGMQVARMGHKKNTRFTWESLMERQKEHLEEVGLR